MNILITGAAGFVGSHLSKTLKKNTIFSLDKKEKNKDIYNIDINNYEKINYFLKRKK